MASDRPATPDDVDAICRSLPEVELGTSWGDVPTYLVRGRGFVLFRHPHPTAVDPTTGEEYDDLLVIVTPSAVEKQALVDDERLPFFTIEHFHNYPAVLIQLTAADPQQIRAAVVDGWLACAPKAVAQQYVTENPT